MGGKKRGSNRQQKRADALHSTLVDDLEQSHKKAKLESKADVDLFVIDTVADPKALRAVKREKALTLKEKEEKKRLKKLGPALIKKQALKLQKFHDAEKLKKMAQEGKSKRDRKVYGRTKKPKLVEAGGFDLWGAPAPTKKKHLVIHTRVAPSMGGISPAILLPSNAPELLKTTPAHKLVTAKKVIPIEVAHGGQSYHPDGELHQDVIGEALAMELKREEAMEYLKTPIAEMSEETLRILINEDSESEEEEDIETMETDVYRKKQEKIPRNVRNRRRRHAALQLVYLERKKQKQFLSTVHFVKSAHKKVRKDELTNKDKRDQIKTWKDEEIAQNPLGHGMASKLSEKDPIRFPSLPVALTSELNGSKDNGNVNVPLRRVKPKGNLLEERVYSLRDRKLLTDVKKSRRVYVQGKKKTRTRGKGENYMLV